MLELTFGTDLDMYAPMRQLRNRLARPGRGGPRPIIGFYDPHERACNLVSFDDSVSRRLEFSVYNRARAASCGEAPKDAAMGRCSDGSATAAAGNAEPGEGASRRPRVAAALGGAVGLTPLSPP